MVEKKYPGQVSFAQRRLSQQRITSVSHNQKESNESLSCAIYGVDGKLFVLSAILIIVFFLSCITVGNASPPISKKNIVNDYQQKITFSVGTSDTAEHTVHLFIISVARQTGLIVTLEENLPTKDFMLHKVPVNNLSVEDWLKRLQLMIPGLRWADCDGAI